MTTATEALRTGSLLLQVAEARYWNVLMLLTQYRINESYGVDSRVAHDCRQLVERVAGFSPQQYVELSRADARWNSSGA
jgi:hypothetical protein